MESKLKEVIDKLKKKDGTKEPSKEDPGEKAPSQGEVATPTPPKIEEPKPVVEDSKTEEPKTEERETKAIAEAYNHNVQLLQNQGVFRVELIQQLSEINENIQLLTATIMKAAGIEKGE